MNRLEGREKLKETSDQFDEQLSEGERIQEDGEESDRILQSMELDGLDSDTQQAAGEVLNEYSDTYNQAIGEVAEQVEGTADTAQGNIESLDANREQVERNAERYSEAAGISDLGRGSAEAGRSKMESDSQEYTELINENEQAIQESRESANKMQSVIGGLFG